MALIGNFSVLYVKKKTVIYFNHAAKIVFIVLFNITKN